MTYAGIGARATPPSVLTAMTVMAGWLARQGWHLNSGGAAGADSAFCRRRAGRPDGPCTSRGPATTGHAGPDCRVLAPSELQSCLAIAARLHPAWDRCSPGVRKLHARNAAILGVGVGSPVDAVVAWTPGGTVTGGTGMAIRIGHRRRHPRAEPGLDDSACAVCERLLAIRRSRFLSLEPEKGVHRAKAR